MSKKQYSSVQIKIPFEDAVSLRNKGLLNLGMDNSLALKIANLKGAGPKNKGVIAAYHFWSWAGILVLGYTLYLSFTDHWWWFILGLIGMQIIWSANKSSNSINMLEEALRDKDFYNRILDVNGWLYQIEEDEAEKYLQQKLNGSQ